MLCVSIATAFALYKPLPVISLSSGRPNTDRRKRFVEKQSLLYPRCQFLTVLCRFWASLHPDQLSVGQLFAFPSRRLSWSRSSKRISNRRTRKQTASVRLRFPIERSAAGLKRMPPFQRLRNVKFQCKVFSIAYIDYRSHCTCSHFWHIQPVGSFFSSTRTLRVRNLLFWEHHQAGM